MALDLQNLQSRFKTANRRSDAPAEIDAALLTEQASRPLARPSQILLSPEAAAAIARNTGTQVSSKAYGGDVKIIDRGGAGLGTKDGGSQAVVNRLFGYKPGIVKGTEVTSVFGANEGVDPNADYYVPPVAPPLPGQPDLASGFTQVPTQMLKGLTPKQREDFAVRNFMMGAYDNATAASLLDGPDKSTQSYLSARADLARTLADVGSKNDEESLKRLDDAIGAFSGASTAFDEASSTFAGAWATGAHPAIVSLRMKGAEMLDLAKNTADAIRKAEEAKAEEAIRKAEGTKEVTASPKTAGSKGGTPDSWEVAPPYESQFDRYIRPTFGAGVARDPTPSEKKPSVGRPIPTIAGRGRHVTYAQFMARRKAEEDMIREYWRAHGVNMPDSTQRELK